MKIYVNYRCYLSLHGSQHTSGLSEKLISIISSFQRYGRCPKILQWSTLLTYSNVSVDDIKPMFDTNDGGEVISSEFSKRKRQKTIKYTPPPLQPRLAKKERNDSIASLKKEYSPKQCGKKKECSVEGCKNPLLAKEKCRKHYNQDWWQKAKK